MDLRRPVDPSTLTALRAERDRFVALAFCWADLLFELDEDARIVFAGGAGRSVIGAVPEALIGRPLADLVVREDRVLLEQLLAIARRRGRIDNASLRLVAADGSRIAVVVAGYSLAELERHFFLAVRRGSPCATDRNAERARDPASGLLDGESFVDLVEAGAASGEITGEHTLTLIESTGYDGLRQRLSEDTEQQLQNTIGAMLKANSLGSDAAGRLTPERYGLLHDSNVDTENLRATISQLTRAADPSGEGATIETASIPLDRHLTGDQQLGKGLIYVLNRFRQQRGEAFSLSEISANISQLAKETTQALGAFRRIVADSAFEIAFQPIVNIVTGTIHHYEALARFVDDADGHGPFETITLAEETGLIADFDLAMARKVVDWLAKMPRNKPLCIAVNISGASVESPAYCTELNRLLAENDWLRARLMFEVTESAKLTRLGSANRFIQSLRRMGYPVCLDDFGAGAANFQYLSRLEVDIVKLDGEALREARKGRKGKAFLRALVGLCRELGVATIAEMVEEEECLRFVRACGIQYAQGYLFGRPAANIFVFKQTVAEAIAS